MNIAACSLSRTETDGCFCCSSKLTLLLLVSVVNLFVVCYFAYFAHLFLGLLELV